MKEIIYKKLQEAFVPSVLEVKDETDRHIGHAGYMVGKPSHFELKIVSSKFNGMSLIQIHQAIYKTLSDEMKNGIHALQIDAKPDI